MTGGIANLDLVCEFDKICQLNKYVYLWVILR